MKSNNQQDDKMRAALDVALRLLRKANNLDTPHENQRCGRCDYCRALLSNADDDDCGECSPIRKALASREQPDLATTLPPTDASTRKDEGCIGTTGGDTASVVTTSVTAQPEAAGGVLSEDEAVEVMGVAECLFKQKYGSLYDLKQKWREMYRALRAAESQSVTDCHQLADNPAQSSGVV